MRPKLLILLMAAMLALAGCAINIETPDDFYEKDDSYDDRNDDWDDDWDDDKKYPVNPPTVPETDDVPTGNDDVKIGYASDDVLNTNMGEVNISYAINGGTIEVSGKLSDRDSGFVLLDFDEIEDEENAKGEIYDDGTFSVSMEIPSSPKKLTVNLFVGEEQYGNFTSLIHSYIKIEKGLGKWSFIASPVLKENIDKYSAKKNIKNYVNAEDDIQSDSAEIKALAAAITKGASDDYEKLLMIHDWVAQNIYYNFDSLYSGRRTPGDALDTLHTKVGVCEGYANLFAALCRAQGIPCRIQGGFALGISTDHEWSAQSLRQDSNHAWNEAYVNGRWVIVDSTWDSPNKLENGVYSKDGDLKHIYFDSDINFFSLSHRSLD